MSVESTLEAQAHPILARTVRPRLANLKPEAARAILDLMMDEADQQLCRELLEKNNQGLLTSDERRELDYLGMTITFLDLMRAKALVCLKKAGELDGVALKSE